MNALIVLDMLNKTQFDIFDFTVLFVLIAYVCDVYVLNKSIPSSVLLCVRLHVCVCICLSLSLCVCVFVSVCVSQR